MNQREKILAAAIGAIAVLYGGNWLYQSNYVAPLDARRADIDRLRGDIAQRELDMARFRKANQQLKRWQAQSLPSDPEIARSLYQAWLVGLVGKAGFIAPNVDSSEPITRKDLYTSLRFSARGRGTPEQLTRFLFDFYRADHLHHIESLNLTPVPRSDELDIALSVEALSLPDGERKDQLTTRVSERLASEQLADYRVIVDRNLFGIGGGGFDAADFAYLTAITEVNGEPEAWFTLRASGELLKLRNGQAFQIGALAGSIVEITDSDVVLDCEDERWLVGVGESLMQASTLPPEY
ncbi:MAG: hypothetical protein WD845_12865 [Pirellulales bacterium]